DIVSLVVGVGAGAFGIARWGWSGLRGIFVRDARHARVSLGVDATKSVGKEIGILRDAAKGKGNFGLGSGSRAEADKLGRAWVGDGYKVASDGKTLVGKDGLRQYRPPSYKGRLGKTQANFEQKFPGQKTKGWQSNGHLDITD
ncbi:MAG: adhesin, partial [Candidatus Sedimenticola sp. (ex Thyasira tokunagai)]